MKEVPEFEASERAHVIILSEFLFKDTGSAQVPLDRNSELQIHLQS